MLRTARQMSVAIHSGKKVVASVENGSSGSVGSPTKLSLYSEIPTEEITLQQFEAFALERLSVLKALETGKAQAVEWVEYVKKQIGKSVIQRHQQIDKIGHHILRLAFCKTEENRRWFITQETALFRYRFEESDAQSIDQFFNENQLTYNAIESSTLNRELQDKLRTLSGNGQLDAGGYYDVRWEDALELVGKRRVLLMAGRAFVGRKDLVSIVVARFRSRLSRT